MSIPSQFLYQLMINHIAPSMLTSFSGLYSSYFSSSQKTIIHTIQDVDDERELELLQMDKMLKWMAILFKEEEDDGNTPKNKQAIQELYSIYKSIGSDYKEYQRWKLYNKNLWMFSTYRRYDTKSLAKKILSDIKLFQEGLKLFLMFEKLDL